jgi:hypothetical protein
MVQSVMRQMMLAGRIGAPVVMLVVSRRVCMFVGLVAKDLLHVDSSLPFWCDLMVVFYVFDVGLLRFFCCSLSLVQRTSSYETASSQLNATETQGIAVSTQTPLFYATQFSCYG